MRKRQKRNGAVKPKSGGNCVFCQNTVFCKPIHKRDALSLSLSLFILSGLPKWGVEVSLWAGPNQNVCTVLTKSTQFPLWSKRSAEAKKIRTPP